MAEFVPFGTVLLVAFFIGATAHVDPCCGAGTVIWGAALADLPPRQRHARLAAIVLARVAILGAFGAWVGAVGPRVHRVWGWFLLGLGILFAYWGWRTFRASLRAAPAACPRPFADFGRSRWANLGLLLIPPPLAFPVFGMAYGGLRPIGPVVGFQLLAVGALGLSLPLIVLTICPPLYRWIARSLEGRRWAAILASSYVLVGALIFFGFAAWNAARSFGLR